MIRKHLLSLFMIVALLSVTVLALCAQDAQPAVQPAAGAPENPADQAQNEPYLIQPEDVIQVDVWGEPSLQRLQFQVTPDGYINVAYVGNVKASGHTAMELSTIIADKLSQEEILKNPKVQVTIMTVHRLQVRVLGQVNRPGLVQIKDGDTVLEAIAEAGSYTDQAYLEGAVLTHNGRESEPVNLKALFHKGDLAQNHALKKGDTIYIPEDTTNKFFVMGEVMRPGQYQLRDNTTILSALMLAGSKTPRGDLKSTMLIRGGAKNPERVPINVAKLIGKADMSQDVSIQPGDVIYVPETSKPDWSKISQILNVISNVGIIRRYGLF